MLHNIYQEHGDVPTNYPWLTNKMSQASCLQPEKKVHFRAGESKGKKTRLARPEQKSISMMRDIVTKFSKVGEVVIDIFAGTFAAAKSGLTLSQYWRFVGGRR